MKVDLMVVESVRLSFRNAAADVESWAVFIVPNILHRRGVRTEYQISAQAALNQHGHSL